MQFHKNAFTFAVIISLSLGGCASPGKRTAIGAGAGAAGGAIIGGIAGGGQGAIIGAGVGAATGGFIGNRLDKQAQELEKVAETKRTADGILVNLKNDLLFETGSANLKESAKTQLSELGAVISKYPEDQITVAGHTDSVRPTRTNDHLSAQRAQAVQDILLEHGLKSNQLRIQGYGEAKPVATNSTAQGRAQNRRVELFITE